LHYHNGGSLPEWLKAMAVRISFQWRGEMTRTNLVAEGLGSGISMQEGIVKQSWLDVVLEIIETAQTPTPCNTRWKHSARSMLRPLQIGST
jgi:hypothetical protein